MKMLVGMFAVMQSAILVGSTFTVKPGTSNWADPQNYDENAGGGTALPKSGDTVVIPAGADVSLSSEDAASCEIFEQLAYLVPLGELSSHLTVDVKDGSAVTLKGVFYNSDKPQFYGCLTKKGQGALIFDNDGTYAREYSCHARNLTVEAGALVLPQNYDDPTGIRSRLGHVVVSNNATLKLAKFTGKWTAVLSLEGEGTVTADQDTELRMDSDISADAYVSDACIFGGVFGEHVKYLSRGRMMLTGRDSRMTATPEVYGDNGCFGVGTKWGTTGVMVFGKKGGSLSSIGSAESFATGEFGGVYRYLGNDEETDKNFDIYIPGGYGVLDGGPFGNLRMKGTISARLPVYGASERMGCLGLTGSNATECVLAGPLTGWSRNGRWILGITKRGSGIWRIADCATSAGNLDREMDGSIRVDEGTLRFDSMKKRGEHCALGDAALMFDPANGAAQGVDWAFLLGRTDSTGIITEGALEYVGTADADVHTRPLALEGNGRLIANGTAKSRYLAVAPRGTCAKTLTLAGISTAENEIADITDTEDAPVSVVKEGTGTWVLGGDQTFHGTLTVRKGTLIVRSYPTNYTWFRWTIRSRFGTDSGAASDDTALAAARFFGLYAADNSCQSLSLVRNDNYASLEPGQVAVGTSRKRADRTNCEVEKMFAAVNERGWYADPFYAEDSVSILKPTLANTNSWIPVVMRLPANAAPVKTYDFASYFGNGSGGTGSAGTKRIVKAWSLEGSVDGLHWDMLHECDRTVEDINYKDNFFASAGDIWTSASAGTHAGGYVLPRGGEAVRAFSVLGNVSGVSLEAGAILKAEGVSPVLSKVTIPAVGSSNAVVDGFLISQDGVLNITGLSRGFDGDLPIEVANGSPIQNFLTWELRKDGERYDRGVLSVRNGRLHLSPSGLMLIVR